MNFFRNFMEATFRALGERGIDYLVLRNYEALPENTTNDVDILIAPESVEMASKAVLDAAHATGWRLSNVGRFSCLSLFFYRPDTLEQTHIDLMHGVLWHSFVFADHRQMLAHRIPLRGFFKPAPEDEAWIDLSTRLLYGGYVKEKYRPFIQDICSSQTSVATDVFSRFLGKRLAFRMVSLCAHGRWIEVERLTANARIHVLLKNLMHPVPLSARLSHDAFRLSNRMCHPPGLMVGIASSDSGWSENVAKALMGELKGTFYPERTFRFDSTSPSARRTAWKNAFRGGLSILVSHDENNLKPQCDLILSDNAFAGKYQTNDSIVDSDSLSHRALSTVLSFLATREQSRSRNRKE